MTTPPTTAYDIFDRDCRRVNDEERELSRQSKVTELVRRFQESIDSEQRVAFWGLIQAGYCRHCGVSGIHCHCENDE